MIKKEVTVQSPDNKQLFIYIPKIVQDDLDVQKGDKLVFKLVGEKWELGRD